MIGEKRARDRYKNSAGQDLRSCTSADDESEQETVVPPKPRAVIVVNPSKPDAEGFGALAERICQQEGWLEPLIIETTEDDPGFGQAREALEKHADVVIAAGGDGTVRAVAEVLAGTQTPMGIVPMGTGNLLARNLRIVLGKPEWALRVALWGKEDTIDVAYGQLAPDGKKTAFMVMAGLGFDAAVMASTNSELKSRVGWLAYVEAGGRKLFGHRTRVSVTVDDAQPYSAKIRSVIGGNCGRLQGGVTLFPDARLDDGILDVMVMSPKNLGQWVGVVVSIISRRRGKGMHTQIHKCRSVVIQAEHYMDVQFDGDAMGKSRYLAMEVQPAAVSVRTATDEQTRKIRGEGWPLPTV